MLEDLSRKSKKAASNKLPLEQLSYLQEQSILNTSKHKPKETPSSPTAANSRMASPHSKKALKDLPSSYEGSPRKSATIHSHHSFTGNDVYFKENVKINAGSFHTTGKEYSFAFLNHFRKPREEEFFEKERREACVVCRLELDFSRRRFP